MGLIYDPAFNASKKHRCSFPDAKRYSYGSIWQCNDCRSYWHVADNEHGISAWYWVSPFHVVQWYRIWKATR